MGAISTHAIREKLARRKTIFDQTLGEARLIHQQRAAVREELAQLKQDSDVITKAIAILNSLSESEQYNAQRRVEALVTDGLRLVRGDSSMSFKIEQTVARGQMAMDFTISYVKGDADIETAVYGGRGGGVVALVGFLLQVIFLVLMRGKVRPVLFLDEALVQLSPRYRPAMSQLLRQVVDSLGIQIILVTHEQVYAREADVVYKFHLNERGETEVSRAGIGGFEKSGAPVSEVHGEARGAGTGSLADQQS